MTDEPNPDLSETLEQIAEQAKPVDLSKAVARKVRSLRRRRNAAGGAAAVLALAIVGGGGYALTRTTGSSSVNASAGGAAASSDFGWFAYTPLPGGTPIVRAYPSSGGFVTPAAPSSGIVTGAAGTTTAPAAPIARVTPATSPQVLTTPVRPITTTDNPGTNPDRTPAAPTTSATAATPTAPATPAATSTTPTLTPPATLTPTAPLPCTVFDDFAPGVGGSLVITDTMKAKARAMGTKLCELVGGGARYNIEEWVSIGGVSGMFNGLTYDVEAHLIGASAGPVNHEAWLAIHLAAAGTTPTFADGTTIELQTDLSKSLKDKIEVEGGPFDAFAAG